MSARAINAKTQRGRGAEPIKAVSKIAFAYQLDKKVLDRVWMERLRQQALLREGKHTYTCATANISQDKKLRVTAEEHGEVARAIDLLEKAIATGGDVRKALKHLRDEITQLTASGFAWLEAMEQELKQ